MKVLKWHMSIQPPIHAQLLIGEPDQALKLQHQLFVFCVCL